MGKPTLLVYARNSIAAAAAILCGVLSEPAYAVPTVNVSSGWFTSFQLYQDDLGNFGPLPAGIVIRCVGAAPYQPNGCEGGGQLIASNTSGTPETLVSNFNSTLIITNTASTAIAGTLFFLTDFSSYLPGSQGVSVSDPALEFASFSSVLFGPDFEDFHSCMTSLTLASCGVLSPDLSAAGFAVSIPSPGQSIGEDYSGQITAQLFPMPEPPEWSYFPLLALICFFIRRPRAAEGR